MRCGCPCCGGWSVSLVPLVAAPGSGGEQGEDGFESLITLSFFVIFSFSKRCLSSSRPGYFNRNLRESTLAGNDYNYEELVKVYQYKYRIMLFLSRSDRIQVWELRRNLWVTSLGEPHRAVRSRYSYLWELDVLPNYAISYPRPVFYLTLVFIIFHIRRSTSSTFKKCGDILWIFNNIWESCGHSFNI